jgi:sugar/nucleoside kinase (ribokinase family)
MFQADTIINSFQNLNVLVVGDVCFDIDQHCNAIGLSLESPTLKAKLVSTSTALGWAGNVAKNICELGASCTLLTRADVSTSSMLNSLCNPHPKLRIARLPCESEIATKTRTWIRHGSSTYKYLQINSEKSNGYINEELDQLIASYAHHGYDIVIFADYSDMITYHTTYEFRKAAKLVARSDKNMIFGSSQFSHTLPMWDKFEYSTIVLNEHEARTWHSSTEFKDYDDPIEDIAFTLAKSIYGNCCITLGPNGAYAYSNGYALKHDGFGILTNDTIGAGDAFLAAYAMASASKLEHASDAVMIGNAWAFLKISRTSTIGELKARCTH